MEAMISKPTNDQKRPRPQKEKDLNCPRCNSTNTKFCYYNNYSLSQPRYFCKSCRRYWTEGGSLRNVPVGGGSRKNKRSSSSSSSTQVSSKIFPDFPPEIFSSQNPKNDHEGQNLNNFFMPNNGFSSSGILSMQEFNFSLDGFGNGYMQGGVQENSTRVFLPFEGLKQESSTSEFEKKQGEARSGH